MVTPLSIVDRGCVATLIDMRRTLSLVTLFVGAIVVGCGSKSDGAVPEEDAQFTADYVDDYENDLDEAVAQDQEQALIDQLDDLDDVEVLDDSSTVGTASYGTKGTPKKRPPHGPVTIMQDDPPFSDPTTA